MPTNPVPNPDWPPADPPADRATDLPKSPEADQCASVPDTSSPLRDLRAFGIEGEEEPRPPIPSLETLRAAALNRLLKLVYNDDLKPEDSRRAADSILRYCARHDPDDSAPPSSPHDDHPNSSPPGGGDDDPDDEGDDDAQQSEADLERLAQELRRTHGPHIPPGQYRWWMHYPPEGEISEDARATDPPESALAGQCSARIPVDPPCPLAVSEPSSGSRDLGPTESPDPNSAESRDLHSSEPRARPQIETVKVKKAPEPSPARLPARPLSQRERRMPRLRRLSRAHRYRTWNRIGRARSATITACNRPLHPTTMSCALRSPHCASPSRAPLRHPTSDIRHPVSTLPFPLSTLATLPRPP